MVSSSNDLDKIDGGLQIQMNMEDRYITALHQQQLLKFE